MSYLSTEQLLFLHHRIIKETGGSEGLANLHMLHSAAGRPRASFGGRDLHPDVHTKAAALVERIIRNHPFVGGNKRTGIAAGALFLRRNGYRLTLTQPEVERLALSVAKGEAPLLELGAALRRGSAASGQD